MRVYKSVKANSKEALKQEVTLLKQDGWRPGPARVDINSLYPHQCRLWKDLKQASGSVELR